MRFMLKNRTNDGKSLNLAVFMDYKDFFNIFFCTFAP